MTSNERQKKEILIDYLRREGYVTYADILNDYELVLFNQDPEKIRSGKQRLSLAYMKPSEGEVWVNGDADMKYVSMLLRHEILHFFFEHEKRALEHLAKKTGIDEDSILDYIEKNKNKLKNKLYSTKTFNKAGDYEISNYGYTEEDKALARSITIYDTVVRALVTEDTNDNWRDLSLEELYDKLERLNELGKKFNIIHGRMSKGVFTDVQGKVHNSESSAQGDDEDEFEESLDEAIIYHTGKFISPTRFDRPDGTPFILIPTEYPSNNSNNDSSEEDDKVTDDQESKNDRSNGKDSDMTDNTPKDFPEDDDEGEGSNSDNEDDPFEYDDPFEDGSFSKDSSDQDSDEESEEGEGSDDGSDDMSDNSGDEQEDDSSDGDDSNDGSPSNNQSQNQQQQKQQPEKQILYYDDKTEKAYLWNETKHKYIQYKG